MEVAEVCTIPIFKGLCDLCVNNPKGHPKIGLDQCLQRFLDIIN